MLEPIGKYEGGHQNNTITPRYRRRTFYAATHRGDRQPASRVVGIHRQHCLLTWYYRTTTAAVWNRHHFQKKMSLGAMPFDKRVLVYAIEYELFAIYILYSPTTVVLVLQQYLYYSSINTVPGGCPWTQTCCKAFKSVGRERLLSSCKGCLLPVCKVGRERMLSSCKGCLLPVCKAFKSVARERLLSSCKGCLLPVCAPVVDRCLLQDNRRTVLCTRCRAGSCYNSSSWDNTIASWRIIIVVASAQRSGQGLTVMWTKTAVAHLSFFLWVLLIALSFLHYYHLLYTAFGVAGLSDTLNTSKYL